MTGVAIEQMLELWCVKLHQLKPTPSPCWLIRVLRPRLLRFSMACSALKFSHAVVKGRPREAVLAGDLRCRRPGLVLVEYADDLLFHEL